MQEYKQTLYDIEDHIGRIPTVFAPQYIKDKLLNSKRQDAERITNAKIHSKELNEWNTELLFELVKQDRVEKREAEKKAKEH